MVRITDTTMLMRHPLVRIWIAGSGGKSLHTSPESFRGPFAASTR